MKKLLFIVLVSTSLYAQNEDSRGFVLPLEFVSGWRGAGEIKQPLYYASFKLNPEYAIANNIIRIGLNNGVYFSNPGFNGYVGAKIDFRIWSLMTTAGLAAEIRSGLAYSYSFEKFSQLSAEIKAIPLDILFLTFRFTKIFKGSNYIGEFGLGLNIDYLFKKKKSNDPFK